MVQGLGTDYTAPSGNAPQPSFRQRGREFLTRETVPVEAAPSARDAGAVPRFATDADRRSWLARRTLQWREDLSPSTWAAKAESSSSSSSDDESGSRVVFFFDPTTRQAWPVYEDTAAEELAARCWTQTADGVLHPPGTNVQTATPNTAATTTPATTPATVPTRSRARLPSLTPGRSVWPEDDWTLPPPAETLKDRFDSGNFEDVVRGIQTAYAALRHAGTANNALSRTLATFARDVAMLPKEAAPDTFAHRSDTQMAAIESFWTQVRRNALTADTSIANRLAVWTVENGLSTAHGLLGRLPA